MANDNDVHGNRSVATDPAGVQRAGASAADGSAATTDSWAVNAGGDWKDSTDWTTGAVPGSGNDAVIGTASVQQITYTSADKSIVNSLTVGQDMFAMSGGTLNILTSASFADGLQQSGGTLQGGMISLMGNSRFTGGSITGSASLANSGSATLSAYAIYDAATLTNTGTVNQTGTIKLGNMSGTGAAIINEAGVYDLTANVNITAVVATASFTNDALLETTGAAGTRVISTDFTNTATGTIAALAGNIEFTGKTTALGGTLSGAGEISVGAGVVTIAGGTSIDAGTFGIVGRTSADLAGSVSVANLFDEAENGNTTINVGSFTLTLTGAAKVASKGGTDVLVGSGSVVNAGSLTVSGSMSLANTLSFINDGTVVDSGIFGFGRGSGAPALTNAAGATFDLALDAGLGVQNGAAFNNAGTLAKISGNFKSTLLDNVTSSGVINSAAGLLDLSGTTNSIGGTVSGTGAVAFDGSGKTTLQAGLVLSVATIELESQATLILAGTQSFAGNFVDIPNSTTTIKLNHSQLALSGAASFGGYQAIVDGPGTLSTSGTTRLSGDGLTLDGTVRWQNSGMVIGQAALSLGSVGTVNVVNARSGVFDVNDNFSITVGGSAEAVFTNAGLFEQTGASGAVEIGSDFSNTGRIIAETGLIDFAAAANVIGGTVGGAGTVEFDNGVTTLEHGVALSVGNIQLDEATLALAANASYAKTFTASGSSSLSLGDYTLTLGGQTTLDNTFIGGSGTLVTSGTTILDGGRTYLVGTAVWRNTGTFENESNINLGDSSGDITQFINTASGLYESAGTSIEPNDMTSSIVANAGTFDVLASADWSIIGANFSSTGTLDVAAGGTILFRGPTTTLGGTLTGAGSVIFGNDITWQFSSSATVTVQSITFGTPNADLTLDSSAIVAGEFNIECDQATQDTVNLDGYALELLSTTNFLTTKNGGTASLTIDNGSLVTFGTTNVVLTTTLNATDWANYGTLSFADYGTLTLGNGITFDENANFINVAGAVFDIQAGAALSQIGSPDSYVQNDGLFDQTSGTGTTTIAMQFINNGTLTVTAGTIEIYGVQQPNGTWVSNYSGDGVINGVVAPRDSHMDMIISAPGNDVSGKTGSPAQVGAALPALGGDNATIAASTASRAAGPAARFIGSGDTARSLSFSDLPGGFEAMGHIAGGLLAATSAGGNETFETSTDIQAGAGAFFMSSLAALAHDAIPANWHG